MLCLAFVVALLLAPSASAASPCATHVLADWRDDGRIDRLYPVACYQEAIDAIPSDLLPYADADEVIERALQSALRDQGITSPRAPAQRPPTAEPPALPPTSTPPVSTTATTSLPVPLMVLGGLALTLLATGGLGWVARRRRDDDSS